MRKFAFAVCFSLALWCAPAVLLSAEAATYAPQSYFFPGKELLGRTIVLDPGHGGSDTGAIGLTGIKEKDVTFAISQDLKGMLEKKGARVILTRKGDRDVSGSNASDVRELGARVEIANRDRADLFISIHADAFDDPGVGGTTTYFFPKTSLDTELAEEIQTELANSIDLVDRGVRSNDFFVLDHTSMPAALVEVAYISNSSEEKLLTSKNFQRKAAQGIFNGIVDYFS